MKIIINTKEFETIILNNVLQVSVTHTGNTEDDNNYNSLQIIYMLEKIKTRLIIKLSDISTSVILEEKKC